MNNYLPTEQIYYIYVICLEQLVIIFLIMFNLIKILGIKQEESGSVGFYMDP